MKIATIVGARPQFIKAATISRTITAQSGISEVLIHTGQHFDANMSDVFFSELDIRRPDHNLGIGGGTHGENTGRMIEAIERVLVAEKPNWVLVYGDTDSTLAGALAAVKLHLPLAHVEAGLRSFNRRMPEEINRVLTDHAADLLFVPTSTAKINLENEGIKGDKVKLVGDVMYDATLYYKQFARKPQSLFINEKAPFVLSTIHRAENTDDPARLVAITNALNGLAKKIDVILPVHPRTVAAIRRHCGEITMSPEIKLIEPVGFLEMAWLLAHCSAVLTDSGGLQKEAYFYKKPCLTFRDETEWIELVSAGFNRLVSPMSAEMLELFEVLKLVKVATNSNLYGNGNAAGEIVAALISYDH